MRLRGVDCSGSMAICGSTTGGGMTASGLGRGIWSGCLRMPGSIRDGVGGCGGLVLGAGTDGGDGGLSGSGSASARVIGMNPRSDMARINVGLDRVTMSLPS